MKKCNIALMLALILIINVGCIGDIDSHKNSIDIVNSDEFRDIKPMLQDSKLSKSIPLDTDTEYKGETIYIALDNGSNTYIQSNYTYNSINNISHIISFFIDFPYSPGIGHKNISIYAPTHWNLTVLEPIETFVYCSVCSIWEFNFTQGVDTTYTITFLSGEGYGIGINGTNQYYPIEEDTTFPIDGDFETDYSNDWIEDDSFQDISLNTSLFSNGSSSLRLFSNTGDSNSIYSNDSIQTGLYFVSFRINVESWISGTLLFKYYDSGFNSETLNTSIINKFQTEIYSIQINKNSVDTESFRFEFSTGEGTVFIDQFKIYSRDISLDNTDTIYNYNVSISYISLDTLQNFGINNINFTLDIVLRNTNETLISYNNYTNSNGYYSTLYNIVFNETELNLRSSHTNYTIGGDPPYSMNTTGLIIYSKYDEGTGTDALDSSGNSNTGVLNTPVWTTAIKGDYALDFELDNTDTVNYGDDPTFTQPNGFYMDMYCKLETAGINQFLATRHNPSNDDKEFYILIDPTDHVFFLVFDKSAIAFIYVVTTASLSINAEHHVGVNYDGSDTVEGLEIYIDGINQTTTTGVSGTFVAIEDTDTFLHVGSRYNADLFFDGVIDEYRFFNRTLDPDEILDYYNSVESSISPSDPISKYLQPRTLNEKSYSEFELNDPIDFLEEDSETLSVYFTDSNTLEYGYYTFSASGSSVELTIGSASTSINSDIYNMLKIRYKFNGSDLNEGYDFLFENSGDTIFYDKNVVNNNDIWVEYTHSLITDWEGIETDWNLQVRNTGGIENIPDNSSLWLDYIRIYHQVDINLHQNKMDAFYFLDSENSSLSYYGKQETLSNHYFDDRDIMLKSPTKTTFYYSAYLDSLYPSSLLIPSSNYTQTLSINKQEDQLPKNLDQMESLFPHALRLILLLFFILLFWRFLTK